VISPEQTKDVLDQLYALLPDESDAVVASFEKKNRETSGNWWVLPPAGAAPMTAPSTSKWRPRNILGISCYYHDAAAALVRDGQVVAAAEEERFSRRKHDNRFPSQAIAFCLRHQGMKVDDIDLIAFYEQPLLKLDRILICGRRWRDQSFAYVQKQLSKSLHERLIVEEVVRSRLEYRGPFTCAAHHLSHAASAFYVSPFENAAILTADGVGEWATTAQYVGKGNHIEPLREIHYPDSLGLLYGTLTAFLGFKVNNDEYKVMGLAGFGQARYRDKIEQLITVFPDSSYRLNLDYFSFMFDDERMFSPALIELLGPPRLDGEPITPYHQDLAASLQAVLEDVLIQITRGLYEAAGQPENLCLAGGVALNGVANWRLFTDTPFKSVWVQPAAGDSGGAIGAALSAFYAGADEVSRPRRYSTLLGPKYSNTDIEIVLKEEQVKYRWYLEEELLERTTELILKDRIIGWFQGRMEFGPRALGSRSILANACNPSMQDILNRRVKFREDFRPFAPAVLAEKTSEYFDLPFESPYMLFVCPVREDKRRVIPSVTHIDGTARVQTVSLDDNPRFYRLLQEVGRHSGVPIVINTSFNIRGEPIVCTPRDAIRCFMKTDIDYLVIGDFIAEKVV
jgi:carbamoyltransferase